MVNKSLKVLVWVSVGLGAFASLLAIRQYFEDKRLMKELENHIHDK